MPEMTEKVRVKRGKRAAFLVKRTKSPYLNVSFFGFCGFAYAGKPEIG